MNSSLDCCEIEGDARLLFTLLDAVDCEELITGTPFRADWNAAKARIAAGTPYEDESHTFYELLAAIDRAGLIDGTWIEQRWRTTEARIRGGL